MEEKIDQIKSRLITFSIVNYIMKYYGMLVNFFTTTIRIPTLILVINKLHIRYRKFGL